MIKYGIKLWSRDIGLINEAEKLIDSKIFHYIELIIDPDFLDVSPFDYDLPYVIHSPHENFGVDIGDETKGRFTRKMINCSMKFADELKARWIILHAGSGSEETAKVTLANFEDERIVLENMPVVGIHGERCLGFDSDSMSPLINEKGLCLDFGHAAKASISLKKDCREIISKFLEMGPKIFHLSDGDFKTEIDQHLRIGEGDFDINYFKKCIEKSKLRFVTLEIPRKNHSSLKEDLDSLNVLEGS